MRISPSVRVTTGLVSLMICLVLVLDLAFGLLPSRDRATKEVREKVSSNLAVQLTPLIQSGDYRTLQTTLREVARRDKEILSVGVRRRDGEIVVQSGNHQQHWVAPKNGVSTLTSVSIPIQLGSDRWGQIEISYRPRAEQGLMAWLKQPLVLLVLSIVMAGSILFYLYMRRVLQYLDPSQVISDRVSNALDTLAEGVMILDTKGHIMLANQAFAKFHPKSAGGLIGRLASELEWLKAGLNPDPYKHPWSRVIRDKQPVVREAVEISQENGERRKLVLNASPVLDDFGKARGCLVTFDDVTEVERMNENLNRLVEQLRVSQAKIESQNEALQKLANHDQLTGCYNRRVFFERGEEIFKHAKHKGQALCCIMTDIDFFKSVNDTYGHPVGDQVIKLVAKFLQSSLRPDDLLCRYGGEEFCILLPGLDYESALQVAGRIRLNVEANCARGVRDVKDMRQVTCSLGIGSIDADVHTLAELIDHADQALYGAKRTGRNKAFLYRDLKNYPDLAAEEAKH